MSRIKKALEKARAERLGRDFSPEVREVRPAAPEARQVEVCYTRTRVVNVPAAELLRRRIVTVDEGNPLADRFKRLRTSVLKETRPRGWNTIQITSFGPDEGKSLVALNLAISIAQDARQTTVLVDLDFRRPAVASLLGLEAETRGLTSYFFEGTPLEDLFINPGIDKLTVLPAGGRVTRSTELVGSPKMESLIRELKHCYDDRYVIIDTPSVGVCPDPLVISEYVDTVLLVARVNHTSQESIKAAMAHIHREKLLGVVLNDVSPKDDVTHY